MVSITILVTACGVAVNELIKSTVFKEEKSRTFS
jgi:hypothetical protein